MHTEEEIQRAAKLVEEFDPSCVPMDDTTELCSEPKPSDQRLGSPGSIA